MTRFDISFVRSPLLTFVVTPLVAASFLLGVSPVQGQSSGAITGQIVDGSGEPLPGANVAIRETQMGGAANQNGRYRLSNLPAGDYTVTASFVGYAQVDTTVTVRAGQTVTQNFRLRASTMQGQQIVVKGQRGTIRTNQTKKEDASIVDVLDLQTLERYPDQTLAESLDRLPGVFTQANLGQGITGTAGRGFKNSFIVVRGIQPDLNSTTVLGQSLVSTTGDRAVALDVLPANVASQVEVVKSRPFCSKRTGSGAKELKAASTGWKDRFLWLKG